MRVNGLTYESAGVMIIFTACKKNGRSIVSRYNFSVKGNKDLTDKLLSSVKKTEVKEKSIQSFVRKLFQIIDGGNEQKIIISSSSKKINERSEDEEDDIIFTHCDGAIIKCFKLEDEEPYGTRYCFSKIFCSNQVEEYSEFLKQFGITVPEELLNCNINGNRKKFDNILEQFSSQFIFKSMRVVKRYDHSANEEKTPKEAEVTSNPIIKFFNRFIKTIYSF